MDITYSAVLCTLWCDQSMLPILYSFRRCPYAIRARMAIAQAGVTVELREVVLSNKPREMLALSKKGTVPVLQVKGQVLDESLAIIYWALEQSDPDQWIVSHLTPEIHQLIERNDGEFKFYLDRYKYWNRYPEQTQSQYRRSAEDFIAQLEKLLCQSKFLLRDKICLADIAIFPFVRQFAFVDRLWFDASPYPRVRQWLEGFLHSPLFLQTMHKQPRWQSDDPCRRFPVAQ